MRDVYSLGAPGGPDLFLTRALPHHYSIFNSYAMYLNFRTIHGKCLLSTKRKSLIFYFSCIFYIDRKQFAIKRREEIIVEQLNTIVELFDVGNGTVTLLLVILYLSILALNVLRILIFANLYEYKRNGDLSRAWIPGILGSKYLTRI